MRLSPMQIVSRFLPQSTAHLEENFPKELAGSNTTYVRFITLTTPRSGSSFLTQSLRSHPQVVSFGELLHSRRPGFNTPGFDNHSKRLKRFRKRRPVEFLKWLMCHGYEHSVRAVGFKVFYVHLERPHFHKASAYLTSLPALRVLHLTRENLLRAYLSKVVMSRAKVTGIKSEAERQAPRVRLEPVGCLQYFEHTRRQQARYEQLFARQQILPVRYEDLVADYDRETGRIQTFLDLVPAPLRARNLRQEIRPLSEAITNYQELRKALESTPWAGFLED